jgi:hypothetical protein
MGTWRDGGRVFEGQEARLQHSYRRLRMVRKGSYFFHKVHLME